MIAVTSIHVVVVCLMVVSGVLMCVLYRLAVLFNQVRMLQDWAGGVTYELLAQEQAHEVALMRERMDDLERELSEHHDPSDSFPAEVA